MKTNYKKAYFVIKRGTLCFKKTAVRDVGGRRKTATIYHVKTANLNSPDITYRIILKVKEIQTTQ